MYLSKAQALPQIWPPPVAELQGIAPSRTIVGCGRKNNVDR
jgi:hypothetical protein